MFEFLKIQFKLGKITANALSTLIGVKITQEQFNEITEGAIKEHN